MRIIAHPASPAGTACGTVSVTVAASTTRMSSTATRVSKVRGPVLNVRRDLGAVDGEVRVDRHLQLVGVHPGHRDHPVAGLQPVRERARSRLDHLEHVQPRR